MAKNTRGGKRRGSWKKGEREEFFVTRLMKRPVYTGVTARCFEAAYKALISGRSDGKSGQMSMVKALLNFSLPPTIPKLPPTPPLS